MSVTAAEGFVAAGCHAGIKRRKFDMALIATEDRQPVPCAAVFTQNKFAAPPVELDRATLKANGGKRVGGDRQFGQRQRRHRRARLQERAADGGSGGRGAAGRQLRTCWSARPGSSARRCRWSRSCRATPKLAKKLSVDGAHDAARGILTTDHQAKQVVIKGSTFTLGGMAKGCGMIAPNMATMLAFLTTDADVPRSRDAEGAQGRVRRDVQHAQRRRRDVDQRYGDAAGFRPARESRS